VRKMYEGGYTSEKGLASESVYCALQESAADRWIKSHETLDHRYMHEDIGYGLVPMVGIAELAAVDTPIMKSMVDVGSALSGIDYWSWGRTLDKMGLSGITPTDLERFLSEGTPTVQ
jgi:opine dehydrogenase